MFTGLIEETGTITSLKKLRGGMELDVRAKKTLKGLAIDDSIAIQGVCLTVVKRTRTTFRVQVVEETLRKTTLGSMEAGDNVNLERSLLPSDRLGGHFVLGHVDCVGKIEKVQKLGTSRMVWIRVRKNYAKWLIPVGSVAVDGISLTIARTKGSVFGVAIIPHTTDVTTSDRWAKDVKVNVEFDVIGKYIENLLKHRRQRSTRKGRKS